MKNVFLIAGTLLFHTIIFCQKTEKKTLYFQTDQSDITSTSQKTLESFKKEVNGKKIKKITLIGHTDFVGSDIYNLKLSQKRVTNVKNFLLDFGYSDQLITTQFEGENQPVADNFSEMGKQKNRRVEILVEYYEDQTSQLVNTQKISINHLLEFEQKFRSFHINPLRDTVLFVDDKGSQLYISKNSFQDVKGNDVNNWVDIEYREYRNAAEMAYSKIPMTYRENDEDFLFNSSGMFEIRGTLNNQSISMKPNSKMVMDYALARKNQNTNFYQLNDKTQSWSKIQDIDKIYLNPTFGKNQIIQKGKGHKKRHKGKRTFWQKIVDFVFQRNFPKNDDGFIPDNAVNLQDNKTDNTLLLDGYAGADAGHTYPDIVKGLNCSSFGVYNCDQIYRLGSPLQIQATYKDENGKVIGDGSVLSMIDLNYNGAFSFNPSYFVCNGKGKNVLVLFTNSGDLYLLEKEKFNEMNITKDGNYTFAMTKMNDKIKNSDDLASYLGISTKN